MFKRYIVEIGMGVDQHGHKKNPTNAAIKAIKNAISNNCLVGLGEIVGLKNVADMAVEVLIAVLTRRTSTRMRSWRLFRSGQRRYPSWKAE